MKTQTFKQDMLFQNKEVKDNLKQQKHYCAALYMRLSKDDERNGESSSIETQRMMLREYCEKNNIAIYNEYIDDGFTGSNYKRPAFEQMIDDAINGNVNMIITKDQSRFGRDAAGALNYREYFIENDIRYVAINDGLDTLNGYNMMYPLKDVINDSYAEDISIKVKTAKRARATQGLFIGSHPPYGYYVDNHKLFIDEETAPVIKRIFELSLQGNGANAISFELSKDKILCPSAHKISKGCTRFIHLYADKPEEEKYCWSYNSIQNILRDVVYIGHLTANKSRVVNRKKQKRKTVPKDEWTLVENTHEPIISKDDFEKVQLLVKSRHNPIRDTEANIFRGLLYCLQCGRALGMATKENKNSIKKYYRCLHHYHNPEECTHTHYLRYDNLYELVLNDIRYIGDLLANRMDELLEYTQQNSYKKVVADKTKTDITKAETRIKVVDSIISKLYEDNACGKINVATFDKQMQARQKEQEEHEGKIAELKGQLEQRLDNTENLDKLRQAIEKHIHIEELTQPILNELIDKIVVGHAETIDGVTKQQIEIYYRFAGQINTN